MRDRSRPFVWRSTPRFWPTALLVLCGAHQALATETTKIGDTSGTPFPSLDCESNRVLTAIEVQHGPSAVGRVRGRCHKVTNLGQWVQGDVQYTDWSSVQDSSQSSSSVAGSCAADSAVSGFQGRVSGSTINALRVACRNLAPDGTFDGSSSPGWSPYIGPPGTGTPSAEVACANNRPAQRLRGRSSSHLHQFWLDCSTPQVTPTFTPAAPPQTYTFTDGQVTEVVAWARSQAFNFTAAPGNPGSFCHFDFGPPNVFLKASGPPPLPGAPLSGEAEAHGSCRFSLFLSRPLQAGWKIKSATFVADGRWAVWNWLQPIKVDSANPAFALRIQDRSSGLGVQFKSLSLEGPGRGNWRDAFRK